MTELPYYAPSGPGSVGSTPAPGAAIHFQLKVTEYRAAKQKTAATVLTIIKIENRLIRGS